MDRYLIFIIALLIGVVIGVVIGFYRLRKQGKRERQLFYRQAHEQDSSPGDVDPDWQTGTQVSTSGATD